MSASSYDPQAPMGVCRGCCEELMVEQFHDCPVLGTMVIATRADFASSDTDVIRAVLDMLVFDELPDAERLRAGRRGIEALLRIESRMEAHDGEHEAH